VSRLRLCFVVESGTDVRLVDGLAQRCQLTVLGRTIEGGVVISQPHEGTATVHEGPASRAAFARFALSHLLRNRAHIDHVIVQGYGVAALAANLASRLTGTATSMLVCSPVERYYACRREHPTPDKPYRAHQLRALEFLARRNARLGRHYVVLSEHLADVVRGHGTRRPVSVIPVYGVDLERFRPTDDDSAARRRALGLPPDGTLIFFSSRIAPEKDGETLRAALRKLLDGGRDVWLLHLSGGFETFRACAERAGVAQRVIARDAVHPEHELPDFYRISDLCVQASREEGLGFSPLEALACETPVVAAAVGGLRETIVDGQTGWTYPAGDAAALALALETALDQGEEAKRRARAGRSMVSDRYERQIVFNRLMEALGEA
jgi:glycosyltransferase involved in cell wall biosynthesis